MNSLMEIIGEYFDTGVKEGEEGRSCDDGQGTAQQLLSAIRSAVLALEQDAVRYRYIKAKHYKDSACDQYEGHRLWFAIYDPKRLGLDVAIDAELRQDTLMDTYSRRAKKKP